MSVAEAEAIAGAFGFHDPAPLASRVIFSLFDQPGSEARLIAPGGASLSWRDGDRAVAAAVLIGESGLYTERPHAFPVTEHEMMHRGNGPDRNWFNEQRSAQVTLRDVEWLLDLERVMRGHAPRSARFLGQAPMYLQHLGWMLLRLRETAEDGTKAERETAWSGLAVVAGLLRDVGAFYLDPATRRASEIDAEIAEADEWERTRPEAIERARDAHRPDAG